MTFPNIRPRGLSVRPLVDDASAPTAGRPTLSRRRGKVLSWNPFDGSNVIEVEKVTYENVPCLNSLDSIIMLPGDRVEILSFEGLWYVIGRITAPGTEDILRVLRYVQGIEKDVSTSAACSVTSYGDLASGDPGPAISFDVPSTGQVWVGLLAEFDITAAGGSSNFESVYMSFELSGANTLAAADSRALRASAGFSGTSTPGARFVGTKSGQFLLTDLSPGTTTFVARYRRAGSGTGTKTNAVLNRRIRARGA